MKWSREAAHVAGKDVRMAKWYLLAYFALLDVATLGVTRSAGTGLATLWPLIISAVGMLSIAVIVQADSPYRSDAFWRTRPFSPSSVAGSKLLAAVLGMVALGVAAQTLALLDYHVRGSALASAIGISAFRFVNVLTFAALIAAVTPDVRTFLLALVLLFVGQTTLSMQIGGQLRLHKVHLEQFETAAQVVGIVVTIGLMVYVYRTRRRAIAIAFLVLWPVVEGMTSAAAPFARPARAVATLPNRVAPQPNELHAWVEHNATSVFGQPVVNVFVRYDIKPTAHVYTLRSVVGELRLKDGTKQRIPAVMPSMAISEPAGVELPGVRWHRGGGPPIPLGRGIQLAFRESQIEALLKDSAQLVLHATLVDELPRINQTIPLRRGARTTQEGERLSITAYDPDAREDVLEVRTQRVSSSRGMPYGEDGYPSEYAKVRYAILSGAGTDAWPLYSRGGSGGGGMGLVIPGAFLWVGEMQLGFSPSVKRPQVQSLYGAKVLLIDWQEVSARPISIDVARQEPLAKLVLRKAPAM